MKKRFIKEEKWPDKETRLFETLASEGHYKLLEYTRRFLEDTGEWFMREELGVLEG